MEIQNAVEVTSEVTSETTSEVTAVNRTDEVVAKISAVAATATEEDLAKHQEMIEKAKAPGAEVINMTPALAALIFTESNKRNRDWRHARSESLARQMQNGEWKLNGQGLQFYRDALLADGQHRTAACALAGVTVPISVFYGMERSAIITIDCGTRRNAADAMDLDGIENSKLIESLIKTANAYEVKAKVEGVKKLESNAEVLEYCMIDMDRAKRAIAIGQISVKGISAPTLSESEAAKIAYIFIKNGWNETATAERLAFFQAGQDENESSPMFRAATMINKSKAKKNSAEKLAAMTQTGLIIRAFQLTEEGAKVVQSNAFRKITDGKELPSPVHS
jgi:hypothetical protein